MLDEEALGERVRAVLQPYASNWSGSLGRGDLVIPCAEVNRVLRAIVAALREAGEAGEAGAAVGELELFEALAETRRLPSIQDQVTALQQRFLVCARRR